jgi:hypothetical protein
MKLRQAANDVMLRINDVALRANGKFQAQKPESPSRAGLYQSGGAMAIQLNL